MNAQATGPFRILVVDDERVLRSTLARLLEGEGYAVQTAANGTDALAHVRAQRPDLVLLDVMMPGLNGFAVCRALHEGPDPVPVIFLTARDSDADEVRALGLGADAYLPKALPETVLLARLAAFARRARAAADPATPFAFASWRVQPASLSMAPAAGGESIALTLRETELLRAFAARPEEVLSRDWLLTRFWGRDADGTEGALTMALARLRRKLGPDGARLRFVRGSGYLFKPSSFQP